MKPFQKLLPATALALALAIFPACGIAQQASEPAQQPTPAGQPPDPQLKISPLKALQNFEPPADEEYQLGPGDEINVEVTGHPELTGKHTVGPDGKITLPVAGTLSVANKTREDAGKAIDALLANYYQNPSTTVGIDKYGSNRVLIMGNVRNPGILYYDGTPTLLDAITRGGLLANASSKDGIPERCVIYRGNDQVMTVQLKDLLRSGSAMADIRLRKNDVIFVPVQQDQFISVMGDVQHPGAQTLTPELTLPMALAQAGGLAEGAGSSPTIQVVQTATNKTISIPYKELMKPGGGLEVTLHPGDTIFVPRSGFYKVTTVISRISPLATLVTLGALM